MRQSNEQQLKELKKRHADSCESVQQKFTEREKLLKDELRWKEKSLKEGLKEKETVLKTELRQKELLIREHRQFVKVSSN